MNCAKIKYLLNRYIDKELTDQKLIAHVEEHIMGCSDCKKELNLLRATKNLIAKQEKITVGDEFFAMLQDKLPIETEATEVKWLPDAGELARKLIPVPAVVTMIIFSLIFVNLNGLNPVDEYIFSDLNAEEMSIVYGYTDNSDLLAIGVF